MEIESQYVKQRQGNLYEKLGGNLVKFFCIFDGSQGPLDNSSLFFFVQICSCISIGKTFFMQKE